jgi:hypothetical protein
MRNLALALIMLTQLHGGPIWVESDYITMVRPAANECKGGGSTVRVFEVAVCVKETPDEVFVKIRSRK